MQQQLDYKESKGFNSIFDREIYVRNHLDDFDFYTYKNFI